MAPENRGWSEDAQGAQSPSYGTRSGSSVSDSVSVSAASEVSERQPLSAPAGAAAEGIDTTGGAYKTPVSRREGEHGMNKVGSHQLRIGDDTIIQQAFGRLLRRAYPTVKQREADVIFKHLDADRSGLLVQAEFVDTGATFRLGIIPFYSCAEKNVMQALPDAPVPAISQARTDSSAAQPVTKAASLEEESAWCCSEPILCLGCGCCNHSQRSSCHRTGHTGSRHLWHTAQTQRWQVNNGDFDERWSIVDVLFCLLFFFEIVLKLFALGRRRLATCAPWRPAYIMADFLLTRGIAMTRL